MAFWRRDRQPADRITSEQLASFGRWSFLKEQSGIDPSGVYGLISPLNELVFTREGVGRSAVIAELHRHAEKGEWEKVGAWKYVREFLEEAPDTLPVIDSGLLALHRMRVTNLGFHLSPADTRRYEAVTGGPAPSDGFFGPPVFDSDFGPTRQYYFDHAIATAAGRTPVRLPCAPGVEPGPIDDAAAAMWDFGLLVHRGPLLVSPDIAFEPNVLRPAIAAATNVDHERFAERVVEKLMDRSGHLHGPWSMLGSARFVEEYLDPATVRTPAYDRALNEGLSLLLSQGQVGVALSIEVLTPRARQRLRELEAQVQ